MIMRKNNWKTTAIVALLSISMVLPTTSGSAAAAFAVTPKDVTTHKATATEPTATPDAKATPPILETDGERIQRMYNAWYLWFVL